MHIYIYITCVYNVHTETWVEWLMNHELANQIRNFTFSTPQVMSCMGYDRPAKGLPGSLALEGWIVPCAGCMVRIYTKGARYPLLYEFYCPGVSKHCMFVSSFHQIWSFAEKHLPIDLWDDGDKCSLLLSWGSIQFLLLPAIWAVQWKES